MGHFEARIDYLNSVKELAVSFVPLRPRRFSFNRRGGEGRQAIHNASAPLL